MDMGLFMEMADELADLRARVEELESMVVPERPGDIPEKRFRKPNVDEVRECMRQYCTEKGIKTSANPNEFIDFYESNGWQIGRAKMKNWRAAARNWVRRNKLTQNAKGTEAYARHGL